MALPDFGVSGEGRNREEISGRSNPGSCSLPVAHPKEAAGGHGNSQGKVWLGEKSGDAGEGLGTLSLKQLSQPEMRQHAALVRFGFPLSHRSTLPGTSETHGWFSKWEFVP